MAVSKSINDLVSRSQAARIAGRFDAAETSCKTGLTQLAAHGGLLFEIAANAYAKGRIGAALTRFHRVRIVMPGVSAVQFNVGVCARATGDAEGACRAFRRALVLDPVARGAMDSMAQSQVTLGDTDFALKLASRQALLDPAAPKALATLGFTAWKAGLTDLALPALKASLVLDPSAHEVDMNVANVLLQSRSPLLAIRRYRRLARLRPKDPASWMNLGVALISLGDWSGASQAYSRLVRINRGCPVNLAEAACFSDLPAIPGHAPSRRTAWHALEFHYQQLSYLLSRNLLPEDYQTELRAYREILDGLDERQRGAVSFDLSNTETEALSRYHDRLVHLASTGWGENSSQGHTPRRPALNPEVDWRRAEANYRESTPAITVVDDFLDQSALSALRRFCLESTIWFEMKGAGYLGAYFRDGFNDPLLLAISEQLTQRMPNLFGRHPLRMIWAYTYEQSMVGINPHADFARINVNFWITPDSANLDPETGGLLIYRRPAPETWGFEQYNAAPGGEIKKFLGDDANNPIRVPHRQNRAVIFDSRLFHETDQLRFRGGIENRRINITMLFGEH